MTEQKAESIVEATIEAVVIRANGNVENLGQVSYWHKNPLRRWLWRMKRWR